MLAGLMSPMFTGQEQTLASQVAVVPCTDAMLLQFYNSPTAA